MTFLSSCPNLKVSQILRNSQSTYLGLGCLASTTANTILNGSRQFLTLYVSLIDFIYIIHHDRNAPTLPIALDSFPRPDRSLLRSDEDEAPTRTGSSIYLVQQQCTQKLSNGLDARDGEILDVGILVGLQKIKQNLQIERSVLQSEIHIILFKLNNIKQTYWRFIVLALAAALLFGNMFAFDTPQALEESIETELHVNQAQFNLLYTYFSLPNIVMCVVIGVVIDKIGVKISVVILSLGVTVCQLLMAISCSVENWTMMLVSRALFGIFSQSLITAQISLISFWFKGKELATAMGLVLTLPQLGGAFNSYLSPIIYQRTQVLSAAFYTGTAFCFLSFLCGVGLYLIEGYAEKTQKQTIGHVEKKEIKCEDIKQFDSKVNIIIITGAISAALYVPFMDNANRFYQYRFCFSQVNAGTAVMYVYISSIAFSIPLGSLIDRLGGRIYFFIGTMAVFLITHLLFLSLPNCHGSQMNVAILGSVFLGLSYSMYSNCLVPLIPLVVKSRIIGTAIGLLSTLENISESVVPQISSLIVSSFNQNNVQTGYKYSEVFYCSIALVGLVVSCLILRYPSTCAKLNQKDFESDQSDNLSSLITESVDLQDSQILGKPKYSNLDL